MAKPVIMHAHIFKNAGSTVDFILKRNFKENAVKPAQKAMRTLTDAEIAGILKSHPNIQSFSSERLNLPLAKVDGYQLLPIAFIRHPADRALSGYEFLKREKQETQSNKLAKSLNIHDFFELALTSNMRLVRNKQVSQFRRDSKQTITKEDYDEVVKTIDQHCFFVGSVERMDASFTLLEEKLKPYFPKIDLAYTSRNINKERPVKLTDRVNEFKKALGPELMQGFIWENRFDYKLHALVQERLQKQIDATPKFDEKLSDFKARCKKLGRKIAPAKKR